LEWSNQESQLRRTTIWDAYIKNIGMVQYRGMRWQDSDIFDVYVEKAKGAAKIEVGKENRKTDVSTEDISEAYKVNKKDVIRLTGYDPFVNYPVEEDKPLLYAQVVSFIDEETKNDGMKMNAVIQIVKSFNQISKINDAIDELSSDTMKLNNNNGTIKQLADTVSKLLSGANALAKDNGISVNFNNSKSKGQNTLTGKMKELELIGFRDAKINMYDIDYCKGMQQVAEISAKAQVDQIGFDENAINELQNIRRELVDSLQKEKDKAVERARRLLVENKDLKEFLKDKGLIDEFGQVVDDE
jgi:histone H3/H4